MVKVDDILPEGMTHFLRQFIQGFPTEQLHDRVDKFPRQCIHCCTMCAMESSIYVMLISAEATLRRTNDAINGGDVRRVPVNQELVVSIRNCEKVSRLRSPPTSGSAPLSGHLSTNPDTSSTREAPRTGHSSFLHDRQMVDSQEKYPASSSTDVPSLLGERTPRLQPPLTEAEAQTLLRNRHPPEDAHLDFLASLISQDLCSVDWSFKTVKEFVKKVPNKILRLGEVSGEGREGHVVSAAYRHEYGIAIKVSREEDSELLHEGLSCWRRLKHPNIVRLLGEVKGPKQCLVFCELSRYGDLEQIMTHSPERVLLPRVVFWVSQIIRAVDYMHSSGVAHRDLKLENCLYFENERVKVADFGFARRITGMRRFGKFYGGTLPYMAPEVIDNVVCDFAKVDVWAVGVIAYILMHRKYPFGRCNRIEVRSRQQEPLDTETAVHQILVPDYRRRPDIHALMTLPWWRPFTISPSDDETLLELVNLIMPNTTPSTTAKAE
uniref:Protein kinase domain-containing protein n=1 Tax=Steinernema glaseri TaxID=37863 RepID=A0A1I7Z7W2_9BILA